MSEKESHRGDRALPHLLPPPGRRAWLHTGTVGEVVKACSVLSLCPATLSNTGCSDRRRNITFSLFLSQWSFYTEPSLETLASKSFGSVFGWSFHFEQRQQNSAVLFCPGWVGFWSVTPNYVVFFSFFLQRVSVWSMAPNYVVFFFLTTSFRLIGDTKLCCLFFFLPSFSLIGYTKLCCLFSFSQRVSVWSVTPKSVLFFLLSFFPGRVSLWRDTEISFFFLSFFFFHDAFYFEQ